MNESDLKLIIFGTILLGVLLRIVQVNERFDSCYNPVKCFLENENESHNYCQLNVLSTIIVQHWLFLLFTMVNVVGMFPVTKGNT